MSVVLSEHLPLLASAPDGIAKLRGLILDLAVRGKLVPQDPNDEPANELLKRITKERARLEAEGVCKKSKSLPPVSEDEKPFALPQAWAWTRLGEITNFGQTDKDGEISETTWVLDLEDIQKDTSVLLQKIRFSERQAKSDKNRFQEGDVLYGKLRPYLNKVIVADEGGVCTTEILPVRGYLGVFPRYLMYAVKRPDFLAYVNAKSYGMKMPRLGTDDGRLALFPLAPEKEQHRIVAKVDELMALCDRLEAEQADAASAHAQLVETLLGTLAQSTDAADLTANWQRLVEHFDTLFTTEVSIDALKQTVLHLAVMGKLVPQDQNDESAGRLLDRVRIERAQTPAQNKGKRSSQLTLVNNEQRFFELPIGWEWTQLGQLAISGPSNGYSPKPCPYETPYRCLTLSATTQGYFKSDCFKFVDIPEATAHQFSLMKGDLLIQRGNSLEYVGIAALYDQESGQFIYPDLMMRIQLTKHVDARFVHNWLISAFGRSYFMRSATGTQGTMPKVNQGTVSGTPIPVPPLAEQHRIVAKVDELMALCDRLKTDLIAARQSQAALADTLIESALEAV